MYTHQMVVESDDAVIVRELASGMRAKLRSSSSSEPRGQTIIHYTIGHRSIPV